MWGLYRLADVVTLPGQLAHELAHVLAGAPWAERMAIVVEPRSSARVRAHIEWREDVPWYAGAICSLAPLVLATVAALLGAWLWVANDFVAPSSVQELALWAIVGVWWSVFAFPSDGDLAAARAAIEGGEGDAT